MISSDYGTLGLLISDSGNVKAKLAQLTAQAASGNVSDSYGGYSGAAAQTAFDLQPQIAHSTALAGNIDAASGRATVTQTVMTQLQSIASTFYAQVQSLSTLGGTSVDTVAAQAQAALQQAAALLNTKDGSVYVFGGSDTATAPIPATAAITSLPYFLTIRTAVQGLAVNGAAATLASTLATAAATTGVTPFAADLKPFPATAPTVRTSDQGASSTVGLLANQNTLTPPLTGASTTGSYMRDLLRSLATLGSLTSAQATNPEFAAVVADTQQSLQGVVAGMAADAGALGAEQAQLKTQKTQLSDTSAALQTQLASVQQVDMAATLSNLQQVQTQLTASYKLISEVKGLSLVNYI